MRMSTHRVIDPDVASHQPRSQQIRVGVVIWLAAAVAGAVSRRLDVIDVLVLFGPLVVVPLGLPLLDLDGDRSLAGTTRLRLLAASALIVAFALPSSPASAALCVPWLAATVAVAWVGVRRWRTAGPVRPAERHLATAAALWLPLAAVHFVLTRAGVTYQHINAELIELAAVHFTFAGFGATTIVTSLVSASIDRRRVLASAAGAALLVGDAVVAVGHVTARPVELVGTTIVTAAVFGMGMLGWQAFPTGTLGRLFARLSALAVVAPMGFALAYSWALSSGSSHLSYDTIAAIHGSLNAVGFVACGLYAWRVGAKPVGSPGLRDFGFDVWGATVLGGLACGLFSCGAWSLLFGFFTAPFGALVGFGLGPPLALILIVVVACQRDLRRWPAHFRRELSIIGMTIAIAVCALPNLDLALLILESNGVGTRAGLAAIANAVVATAAVGAIGWLAGRHVAHRHLGRLGVSA